MPAIAKTHLKEGYHQKIVEKNLWKDAVRAYLANVAPMAVNSITLVVMAVSLAGVLRAVLSRRAIRCACLGTVFRLPMSTVTIIEDGLMLAMAALALVMPH